MIHNNNNGIWVLHTLDQCQNKSCGDDGRKVKEERDETKHKAMKVTVDDRDDNKSTLSKESEE